MFFLQKVFNSCCGESWGAVLSSAIRFMNFQPVQEDSFSLRNALFKTGVPEMVNLLTFHITAELDFTLAPP